MVQIAPTMNRMRRQRVNAELEAVAWTIMRSIFSTRRISERAFVTGVRGCLSSIAPTLLDGGECVNSARMLKKSPFPPAQPRRAETRLFPWFVLASLRDSTYRGMPLGYLNHWRGFSVRQDQLRGRTAHTKCGTYLLASSLAAALPAERRVLARRGWAGEMSGLFEHPVWRPSVIAIVLKNEASAHLESFQQTPSPS